jgi:hypothetical protein
MLAAGKGHVFLVSAGGMLPMGGVCSQQAVVDDPRVGVYLRHSSY